jgi:hypothetical protein
VREEREEEWMRMREGVRKTQREYENEREQEITIARVA